MQPKSHTHQKLQYPLTSPVHCTSLCISSLLVEAIIHFGCMTHPPALDAGNTDNQFVIHDQPLPSSGSENLCKKDLGQMLTKEVLGRGANSGEQVCAKFYPTLCFFWVFYANYCLFLC